jgi:hypothetical protein
MPFSNPVIAGDTLIRPSIQSPGYIAGQTGWSINADGSADFTGGVIQPACKRYNMVPLTTISPAGSEINIPCYGQTAIPDTNYYVFNGSDAYMTINKAGRYLVSMQLTWPNQGTTNTVVLRGYRTRAGVSTMVLVNEVHTGGTDAFMTHQVQDQVICQAGDRLSLNAWCPGGSGVATIRGGVLDEASTWIAAIWMGPTPPTP